MSSWGEGSIKVYKILGKGHSGGMASVLKDEAKERHCNQKTIPCPVWTVWNRETVAEQSAVPWLYL